MDDDRNHHGCDDVAMSSCNGSRKGEWQLEACSEHCAAEYGKLYGRFGTNPLLAATQTKSESYPNRLNSSIDFDKNPNNPPGHGFDLKKGVD